MREKKRLYTALAAAAVCLLCLLIYIGCSSPEEKGTRIQVFYLNSEGNGLESRTLRSAPQRRIRCHSAGAR